MVTRRGAALLLLAVLFGAVAHPAWACSMCRCGDPTFNALGTDVFSSGTLRLAIDWDRADKSQGPAEDGESLVQNAVTATASWSLADRVTLVARIPYAFKSLTTTSDGASEVTTADGIADPEFSGWLRLWGSPFEAGVGRRAWLSVQAGVKTSWGRNDLAGPDGVRLDEHAQPGTGSTDPFAGLGGFYLLDATSSLYGSVQYRWTGTNRYGYRSGRIFLANAAYERKLGEVLDAVVELNYRWAGKDVVSCGGVVDPDTGGAILYVTPRLLASLGGNVVARAAVLLPTLRNLNGIQTERAVVSAGLTVSF